jgi:beta-lactamase class A
MIDRRQFACLTTATLFAAPALARSPVPLDLAAAVKAAERGTGGRIGLAVHDTATGRRFAWRGDERFPMASTFKALLAAAILERVDAGKDRLDRAIPIARRDIVGNSPVSEKHVGGTATVAELAEATVIYSDNTAANLLLPAVGGPAGFTTFLRRIGDPVTRLDRIEPMMS